MSHGPNLLQTLMFWLDKKVPQVEIEEQVVEVPVGKTGSKCL